MKQNTCTYAMRTFMLLVLFVIMHLFLYHNSNYWNVGRARHQQQDEPKLDNKHDSENLHPAKQKTIILYWTKYFGRNDFEIGLGSKPFRSCPDLDCLTTNDRAWFNQSNAILFHGRDLHADDLPPPEWRRPEQNFVFVLQESPIHTKLSLLRQPIFHNFFNRTMTYRRDSDILHLYGQMKCIDSSPSSNCLDFPRATNATAQQENLTAIIQTDLASKNRTVAWFVSNCNTNSRRESLVRRLSEFIPVDVYGKCAAAGKDAPRCSSRSECDLMLSRHHRFYLSFENSLCPDYVTEKLYRPLAHGVVPVVYGGADYSLFLPAGSYVNAMDFDSPHKLAEHLNRLVVDVKLYSTYFNWRVKYKMDWTSGGWCPLCRLLKDPQLKNKSYSNMGDWWAGDAINRTCISPPKTLI